MFKIILVVLLLVFVEIIGGEVFEAEEASLLSTTSLPSTIQVHQSEYVCGELTNSTAHQPAGLKISVKFPSIQMNWLRPACIGNIRRYIVSVDQLTRVQKTVTCSADQCSYRFNAEECQFCFFSNVTYTFRVTAILYGDEIAPGAFVDTRVEIEACTQLPTVENADTRCDGTSVVHSSSSAVDTSRSEADITSLHWKTGAECRVQCLPGFAQDYVTTSTHTCSSGRQWQPPIDNVECRLTAPVQQANIRYRLRYNVESLDFLDYQFEGLVRKYSDIFCTVPDEECGIEKLSHAPVAIASNQSQVEVIMTLRPPLYLIEDQQPLLETVEHVLRSVNEDNAFMTLIDYQEVRLLLPQLNHLSQKISAEFCCHECPPGYYYQSERCIQCTNGQCKE